MKRLANDLYLLRGFPPHAINVYLMGDVLLDAGTRHASKRILKQLRGHTIAAHALTHAHPDHQGSSHLICEMLGIPLWCGRADADAAEDPALMMERLPKHWLTHRIAAHWTGPAHPIARHLVENDEVGGFTILDTPGHTAGHVAFWRASDRVLIVGDVLRNLSLYTGLPSFGEPPSIFTADPAQNRRSARKLAALEPALVCFGHGPPLRDTSKFVNFLTSLPE
jgi:hydroxyacylglutathione hydrolase